MAENTYVTATGFVQFDPQVREANGKKVTDVVLKTPGGDSLQIRVTIWPELEYEGTIEKGDFLAVDGKFTVNTWEDKEGKKQTSWQISANYLALVKGAKRTERAVVSSGAESKLPF